MNDNHIVLIDRWQAETRMARVRHGVVEDFDQEIDSHRLKKGNIYMGRVMRVEPSLQAVFVDFGFDKHGFLAFSDIALPPSSESPALDHSKQEDSKQEDSGTLQDSPTVIDHGSLLPVSAFVADVAENDESASLDTADLSCSPQFAVSLLDPDDKPPARVPSPKKLLASVQAWVKANPLIMVQVIKDERGSKGAALTTFITLSGRYGFFLPNTPDSSGVSKKITSSVTRAQLHQVIQELAIAQGMSLILRSAAADRKKSEIKRDYDYVMKKWTSIQNKSNDHVGLVLEEDPLLIRCLRNSRLKDISAIYIEGQDLYKQARHYARAVMPSFLPHLHLGESGLFTAHRVEEQIAALYDAKVHLPSGGAIVITPTEALVSIDVNSAKATQKKNVNETALATNLEAAAMIARHLRLRDLAGLIVIDFIDLPSSKRSVVEKALKEALADDRAKIKVGKISEFGLLEMSRQCLRQSLLETNTVLCPSCAGAGRLMSNATQTLQALRDLERWAGMAQGHHPVLSVVGPESLVLTILNGHRSYLSELEQRYGLVFQLTISPPHPCSPVSGLTLKTSICPLESSQSSDKTIHANKPKKKKTRRKKKTTPTESLLSSDLSLLGSLPPSPSETDPAAPSDFHDDKERPFVLLKDPAGALTAVQPVPSPAPSATLSDSQTSIPSSASAGNTTTPTKPKRRRRTKARPTSDHNEATATPTSSNTEPLAPHQSSSNVLPTTESLVINTSPGKKTPRHSRHKPNVKPSHDSAQTKRQPSHAGKGIILPPMISPLKRS